MVSRTDNASPFLVGLFGSQRGWSRSVRWDNLTLNSSPSANEDPVVAYDDYYPFGMQMETRCQNVGNSDARYKFTGKERDVETGYDYFGARYY